METTFRFFFGSARATAMTLIVGFIGFAAFAPQAAGNLVYQVAYAAATGLVLAISRLFEATIGRREIQDLLAVIVFFAIVVGLFRSFFRRGGRRR